MVIFENYEETVSATFFAIRSYMQKRDDLPFSWEAMSYNALNYALISNGLPGVSYEDIEEYLTL